MKLVDRKKRRDEVDKELRKNELLVLILEIQNSFIVAWLIIMPFLSMVFMSSEYTTGMLAMPLALILYWPVLIFNYCIFLTSFRKQLLNKQKKRAIVAGFILDWVFLHAFECFGLLYTTKWLIVNSISIFTLHILSTIVIISRFDKNKDLQEPLKYDEKILIDSLIRIIDFSIILGISLIMILIIGGYIGTGVIIYTFGLLIVVSVSVLTLVLTIKGKKSLVTFNVIFSVLAIIVGVLSLVLSIGNIIFKILSIFLIGITILGIQHLFIVKKYLKKRNEKQKVIN